MEFLKKLIRGLSSLAFKFFILITAIVAALVMTFNSPKKVEKSLSDSGVYSTFIESALKEVQKSNDKDKSAGSDKIPIDNPAVIAAANKAFNPQLLQSSTEKALDNIYPWLQGKTPELKFTLDFTQAKKTFAQEVGKAAQKQLASLPVCTTAQAKAQGSDIDPFSATCQPAGLNVKAQGQKLTNDLANSKDFLGHPIVGVDSTKKQLEGEESKPFNDIIWELPKVYRWIDASPWLLAGLAGLAGLITFLLYDSKRRGLRNLAIALSVTGAGLLLVTLVITKGFNELNKPTGKLGEAIKGSFQQTIIKALNSIANSIEHILLWFGIAYVVIGVGTLLVLHFTKPKKSITADDKKEASVSDKDKTKVPEPKTPPKPASKPIQG